MIFLMALAWPSHRIFVHHDLDGKCQFCSVCVNPQLNADCGTELLPDPPVPVLPVQERVYDLVSAVPADIFDSRAPPSFL